MSIGRCPWLALFLTMLAQASPAAGQVTSQPIHLGRYSVASQSFVPLPTSTGLTQVVYDNTSPADLLGGYTFFGIGPASNSETCYMDFGSLSAGGFNQIVEMQIAYGTIRFDDGSSPVNLLVSLHELTGLGGSSSINIYSFPLTGLPGTTNPAVEASYTLDVALPSAVHIPDGPLGYSFQIDAGDTP